MSEFLGVVQQVLVQKVRVPNDILYKFSGSACDPAKEGNKFMRWF